MKTLEELRSKIEAIPCAFAKYASDVGDGFPVSSDSETNLRDGFLPKYSTPGNPIRLVDFNRLGEMATRELAFRQHGGEHTFSADSMALTGGYAEGALLLADDGTYAKMVESQESDNSLDFTSSGNPAAIDGLSLLPSDPMDAKPRVLWRSANLVYGAAEGNLRLSVDFSRRNNVSPGETLATDSLVVVGSAYFERDVVYSSDYAVVSVKGTVSLTRNGLTKTFSLENKGLAGMRVETLFLGIFFEPPYPAELCGTANYSVAFFVKAGTAVTVSIATKKKGDSAYGAASTLTDGVYSYPISIVKE